MVNYLHNIKIKLVSSIFYLFRIFPIKKNKIVFCNFFGKGFGCNPKYIAQEIINQKLNYDLVWLSKKIKEDKFPEKIRCVKYKSLNAIFELATAKIWIDNCRKPIWVKKRKSQYYIQTWHGVVSFKKVEKDVEEKLSSRYVKAAKNDSKMANLFISSCQYRTNIFKKSFWYNKEILEIGSPKCDIFYISSNIKEKIHTYFNIPIKTKIILYAPTFRVDGNINVYNLDFKRLITIFENRDNEKYICLIRLHPNITQKSNDLLYNNKIINASFYDDMQELLYASDILITDYSSTMFEFALMNKPVFLYTPDIVDYKKDRNFYFNINELPFIVAENNNEMEEKINKFNFNLYNKKLNEFITQLSLKKDGKASYKAVEKIKKIINMEE